MILSGIDADATKVGELGEAVLTAGPSYYLAAPKDHTPVPEEMEVPRLVFQR